MIGSQGMRYVWQARGAMAPGLPVFSPWPDGVLAEYRWHRQGLATLPSSSSTARCSLSRGRATGSKTGLEKRGNEFFCEPRRWPVLIRPSLAGFEPTGDRFPNRGEARFPTQDSARRPPNHRVNGEQVASSAVEKGCHLVGHGTHLGWLHHDRIRQPCTQVSEAHLI